MDKKKQREEEYLGTYSKGSELYGLRKEDLEKKDLKRSQLRIAYQSDPLVAGEQYKQAVKSIQTTAKLDALKANVSIICHYLESGHDDDEAKFIVFSESIGQLLASINNCTELKLQVWLSIGVMPSKYCELVRGQIKWLEDLACSTSEFMDEALLILKNLSIGSTLLATEILSNEKLCKHIAKLCESTMKDEKACSTYIIFIKALFENSSSSISLLKSVCTTMCLNNIQNIFVPLIILQVKVPYNVFYVLKILISLYKNNVVESIFTQDIYDYIMANITNTTDESVSKLAIDALYSFLFYQQDQVKLAGLISSEKIMDICNKALGSKHNKEWIYFIANICFISKDSYLRKSIELGIHDVLIELSNKCPEMWHLAIKSLTKILKIADISQLSKVFNGKVMNFISGKLNLQTANMEFSKRILQFLKVVMELKLNNKFPALFKHFMETGGFDQLYSSTKMNPKLSAKIDYILKAIELPTDKS